jgi:putative membrane protein
MNKDLVLREKLAIARTKMAIERTFLSYVRTALYFSIAGITIHQVLQKNYVWFIAVIFFVLSFLILAFGIYQTAKQVKNLKENEKHIGDYVLDFLEE